MARTLPPGLGTKISASGQSPTLSLTVQDLVQRPTLLASGGTAARSSAILSPSGTIIRASLPQGASPQSITVQRITPAGPASWTAAGTTVTTNAVPAAGCCLVRSGSLTRLFYQRVADSYIVYRDSSDDGLTWGTETVTVSGLPAGMSHCYGVAADSTTRIWVAYALYDPNGMCGMYTSAFTTSWSAWTAAGPSSPGWGQIRGLACANIAGVRRFAAGVGLRGYVSGISAGWFTWDGSAYSTFSAIQQLDTPTQGLSCAYPDLFYDGSNALGDGLNWYAAVTLADDGSVSTAAHSRTTIYRSADGATWQPWLAAGTALSHGAHVVVMGGTVYLFDAATCYTVTGPPAPVDLGDDVLTLQISERYDQPARLDLSLHNGGGQYTGAAWLRDNATLTLAFGYSGQTVATHTLYLDDWLVEASGQECLLRLSARCGLKLLDYPCTLQLVYSNQTVAQIATALCRQAGLTLAPLPATQQFAQTVSCFRVTPGETWLSALHRLAELYGFNLRSDSSARVILFEPQAGDPGTWSYGTEALATGYGEVADRPNVVRVIGTAGAWSEAVDEANVLLVGQERLRLIVDRLLDTSAKCAIRAGLALREVQRGAIHGALIAAINPQHEVGDVISYSDADAGIPSTSLRISGMTWSVDLDAVRWEHHLELEAP